MLQRNIASVLLGLPDTWVCRCYVHLTLWKPFAKWHCVTTVISLNAVRFESLTKNILAKAIFSTWKWKIIWMRIWITKTQKISGFLNAYRTLAYAVTGLKMLSTKQIYNMDKRKCMKYNLRFYFCPCFWEAFLSLHQTPHYSLFPTGHQFQLQWQLSTWYVRQYSTMSNKFIHSKETNTFEVPNEWSERNHKITHRYVPSQCFYSLIHVTFSCPSAHHDSIWEGGVKTPRITKPVLSHTVPSDKILATKLSVLTFLLFHNISLAIKWNRWLFHSYFLVSPFLWVNGFQHNLPTQPGTKRDLGTTWMCVISLTLHLLKTWGKCWEPTEREAGDLAWKSYRSENLLPL